MLINKKILKQHKAIEKCQIKNDQDYERADNKRRFKTVCPNDY